MIVRQFNDAGIVEFRSFLCACRADPTLPVPHSLLEDDRLTLVVGPRVEVEWRRLARKADAAHYISRILAPIPEHEVAANDGLWSWLSLFYFDEVCPPRSGRRTVRNDYHYVFEPKNARHFYRHLLFVSWQVLRLAGDHNRLFLGTSLSTLDKMTTEVMKRLFLTRIPCIFAVLDHLYWDEIRGKARAGVVSQNQIKPGDLAHRLPLRIRQLEKTYDLLSLKADQLVELLGDEFQQGRGRTASRRQASLEAIAGAPGRLR